MQIVLRAEARLRGLKRYFTGKACKNGHMVERRTKNAVCLKCVILAGIARRKTRPETSRASALRYYHKNPKRCMERQKIRRAKV